MATQDLASLQAQIKKELIAQRTMLPPPAFQKITLKNKKFAVPGETPTDGPLKCIILDWRYHADYFPGIYNSMNPVPPICSAAGKDANNLVISAKSESPQAENCKECPHSKFGSALVGKGKACKDTIRLAIVPTNPTADMSPWILDVSPTGLTSFTTYVYGLQEGLELLPLQVETEISFNPKFDYPTLIFTAAAPHDYLGIAMSLRNSAQALLGD